MTRPPIADLAAAAEREKAAREQIAALEAELAQERRFSEQLDADWDRKWQDALEREKATTERIRDAWYAARDAANGDRIVGSADDRTAFDRGMDHAERIFLAILADPDAATPHTGDYDMIAADLRTLRRMLRHITEDMTAEQWMAYSRIERALGHGVYAFSEPSPSPEPAPPLDVERLARAMYPDPLAEGQTWDDAMCDAIEVAAEYARLSVAAAEPPAAFIQASVEARDRHRAEGQE